MSSEQLKKGEKKKSKRARQSTEAEGDLAADVKAFASQLGLVAGVQTGNGFDDSDFRPEAAQKRNGGKAKGGQDTSEQRVKSGSEAGPSGRSPQEARQPKGVRGPDRNSNRAAEERSEVNARAWKSSVGPRPGEKRGQASLLGRDDPTIWFEALDALAPLDIKGNIPQIDEWALEERRNTAEAALENEAEAFERDLDKRNKADAKWLQQVRRSGTASDKLAAMTLLIQESAVANLKSLDELLRWVGKRSGARAVAGQAMDALKELFKNVLLPPRRLLFLEQQPLGALPEGRDGQRRLLYCYLEDAIKKRYSQFVKALEEASRDSLEFIKEKAIKSIFDMLRAKPEQEAFLLTALVNKLGDPSRKLASKAGYLLSQLLEEHPAMKLIVAKEVERFMFRPGLAPRARYYAIVFLNQMVLSRRPEQGGSDLARKLIDIYFSLFQLILEGKLGHAADLRAAREQKAAVQKQGKKGKKPRTFRQPAKSAGTGQAGKPIAAFKGQDVAEVDAKMLAALLAGVRRAFPFVEATHTEALMQKHAHALFRIIHTATFGVAVQALALLFQLLDARSAVSDRFYRALYGILLSPELARSNKSTIFLSLLFRAMRADVSDRRVAAFVKRTLQVAMEQLPNFTCGCLLLLSELLKERPALWNAILEPEDADDDVEHFIDQPDPDVPDDSHPRSSDSKPQKASAAAAFRGKHDYEGEGDDLATDDLLAAVTSENGYDMLKREPLYCKAERACLWELVPLAGHVHPSVAAMARTLLAGVPIDYTGDPLRDLSITAFLDKLVQRKPKAQAKGASLMQPLTKDPEELLTPAFAGLSAADVAPDTTYFHKFFEIKAQRQAAGLRPKGKKKKRRDDEDGPLGSDEEDSDAESGASEEIEGFMEGVEESEDEAGPGDYDGLAAAMGVGSDTGFDALDAEDGSELLSADEGAQLNEDGSEPLSGDEGGEGNEDGFSDLDEAAFGSSDEEATEADSEASEDIDPFELAGPSDDEDGSGSSGSEGGDDGLEPSQGGWVLAEGAADIMAEDRELPKKRKVKLRQEEATGGAKQKLAKKAAQDGKSVFASAEEYAHLIDSEPVGQIGGNASVSKGAKDIILTKRMRGRTKSKLASSR